MASKHLRFKKEFEAIGQQPSEQRIINSKIPRYIKIEKILSLFGLLQLKVIFVASQLLSFKMVAILFFDQSFLICRGFYEDQLLRG